MASAALVTSLASSRVQTLQAMQLLLRTAALFQNIVLVLLGGCGWQSPRPALHQAESVAVTLKPSAVVVAAGSLHIMQMKEIVTVSCAIARCLIIHPVQTMDHA